MKQYLINILLWMDEGLNVFFLLGKPHETISEHAARARDEDKRWGCVVCNILDGIWVDHCNNVIAGSKQGKNVTSGSPQ